MGHLTQRVETDIKDIVAEIESEQEAVSMENIRANMETLADKILKSGFLGVRKKRSKEHSILIETQRVLIGIFFNGMCDVIRLDTGERLYHKKNKDVDIERIIAIDKSLQWPDNVDKIMHRWIKKEAIKKKEKQSRISARDKEIKSIPKRNYKLKLLIDSEDVGTNVSALKDDYITRINLLNSFDKIFRLKFAIIKIEESDPQEEFNISIAPNKDTGVVLIKIHPYFRSVYEKESEAKEIIRKIYTNLTEQIGKIQPIINYWYNELIDE